MITEAFIAAVREVRACCTAQQWTLLLDAVSRLSADPLNKLDKLLPPDSLSPNASWLLSRACRLCSNSSIVEARAVMVAVDHFASQKTVQVTPVWTGPDNGTFPVRRYDQVLYDQIAAARERILIVTFAAYRVDQLVKLLSGALDRNVKLTLVLESEESSAGQLTHDALDAFRGLTHRNAGVLTWPLDRRQRNQKGRPGKLHAKTAVVDSSTIIGSGNLTDDAFNRNIELGVVIEDQAFADSIYDHFAALISCGQLMPIN